MAPRWKMVTSTLRLRDEDAAVPVAASAVRVRKLGLPATPRAKKAMPPPLRNILRVNMGVLLFSPIRIVIVSETPATPGSRPPPAPGARGGGGRRAPSARRP